MAISVSQNQSIALRPIGVKACYQAHTVSHTTTLVTLAIPRSEVKTRHFPLHLSENPMVRIQKSQPKRHLPPRLLMISPTLWLTFQSG